MTRRAWWLFAVVAVLWGIPYLFIRVAVEADVAPVVLVWVRTGVAAVLLLPIALHRGAFRGLRERWRILLALTLVQVTVPFLLITYGEQLISSSLAGLLVATEPLLVVVLLAVLTRTRGRSEHSGERIDASRVLGLFVGLAGVAALLGIDVGTSGPGLLGASLVLLAALSYAAAALLIRKVTVSADPIGVITTILAVNTIVLTPAAVLKLPGSWPHPEVTASLAALAILCTAAGFVAFFALIAEAGPARGTVVFYAAPAVTVAAGALILREPITIGTAIGLVLVLLGSYLATSGFPTRRR